MEFKQIRSNKKFRQFNNKNNAQLAFNLIIEIIVVNLPNNSYRFVNLMLILVKPSNPCG